jgi:pimeloyl-ACP methyl ester carboxylesterase
VHGIAYTHEYWNFPDPSGGTDRYNYSKAANDAGFATLAIDRIGSGRSSHPPSTSITIESNAYTVHQVVQAIRNGKITSPKGTRFENVVYVGHSYGTWIGWYEVSRYNDVDAAVFTAAFEELTVTAPLIVLPSMYPATLDSQFAGHGLDPGYLTTLPGTRDELFYEPAEVDPAVVRHDEATKSTVRITEVNNYPQILNEPLDIRVPVLLVAGDLDSLFCRENFAAFPPATDGSGPVGTAIGDLVEPYEDETAPESQDVIGSRLGGADCDTPQALVADEKDHLGPNVPSVDAFVLPHAGHDLNQALNAGEYFAATNHWVSKTVRN